MQAFVRGFSRRIVTFRFLMTSCKRPAAENVQLNCSPLSANVDEKVKISIRGLEPNQKISLQAKLVGEVKDRYRSLAHYIADQHGRICLNTHPSVGGSYVGIEPMGFIWSLALEPGQRLTQRFMKRDVTKPFAINIAVFNGHLDILKTDNCNPLSCLTIERHYMAAGVKRVTVHEGRLRGTLFLPPGKGPFQGVISLLGANGGKFEFKAALLASNGFAALALAYLKYDDLPNEMANLELEYFIEAVDWLKNHPSIISAGVGIIGLSKGAEFGLYLAANCKDVVALASVSTNYSLSLCSMFYKGKQLPCFESDLSKIVILEDDSLQWRDCFHDDWSGRIQDNPKLIPVENARASLLFVYGTDDRLVNGKLAASKIFERMQAFGKEGQCTRLGYHGAGHLIEPPYSPHVFMGYQHEMRICTAYGGEPKPHSVAQEHAWSKIIEFFRNNLPSKMSYKKHII